MWGKLIGWVTGADVQKTIDTVSSGIDMAFYTDEEKALTNGKIIDAKLKAISKQSIARRIIAVAVTINTLLLVNVAIIAEAMDRTEFSKFVFNVLTEFLLQPFTVVIGFYFLVQFAKSK